MSREVRGMPALWMHAAQVAAAGRNGDTMLAHITPDEARMLRAAGGSGTINPKTGLPEFFKLPKGLKKALPYVAGAAALGAGAYYSGAFDGMGDWLGAGAGTDSFGPVDMGSYGSDGWGYGVAESLGIDATTGADAYGTGWWGSAVPPEYIEATATATGGGVAAESANAALNSPLPDGAITPTAPSNAGTGMSSAKGGARSGVLPDIDKFVRENRALATVALMGGLYGLSKMSEQEARKQAEKRSIFDPNKSEYRATPGQEFSSQPTRRVTTPPPAGYNPARDGAWNFYQQGTQPRRYAEGGPVGLEALTHGAIRGPGAGMEDKIHGTIDGRREVRLSDGEHVVPADVVSSLGDGSSEAGHKRLSDMIHRVRAEKTGSTRQPPPIDPRRVMPR